MNPILLQKQLRENSTDLQDFCNDLKGWGEEMKRKEQSLKKGSPAVNSKNLASSKVMKTDMQPAPKKKKSSGTVRRIGSTDYAKWDKFDVEAACDKLDDDQNEDSELTDEFDNSSRDEALVQKEKGNQFVKKQKWDEAITCYTKAIDCYSYDPVFYANRALCYLKTGQMEKAEKDCNLSLKLDNTYVKAYQRRAAAKEFLSKLPEAHADLLKVLEFEPNNKESRLALEKLKNKMGIGDKDIEQRPISKFTASRNKIPLSSNTSSLKPVVPQEKSEHPSSLNTSESLFPNWPKDDDIVLVKPINKPPHLRSKKPLKRIEIVENNFNITDVSSNKETNGDDAIKRHVIENIRTPESNKSVIEDIKEVENTIVDEPKKITSAFKKTRTDYMKSCTEPETALPKAEKKSDYTNSDDLLITEKRVPENNMKDIKNVSNLNLSQQTKIVENKLESPKTSVQFYSTWRQLKSASEKYTYLKLVKPEDIPAIFQESLEINVFSEILHILATEFVENKDAVYKILMFFTKVKRFSAFTMFMDSTDRNCLLKLVAYIRDEEQKPKENIDALIKMYEL